MIIYSCCVPVQVPPGGMLVDAWYACLPFIRGLRLPHQLLVVFPLCLFQKKVHLRYYNTVVVQSTKSSIRYLNYYKKYNYTHTHTHTQFTVLLSILTIYLHIYRYTNTNINFSFTIINIVDFSNILFQTSID